ncbi:RRQRL motif-containing zinc-binding protein [Kutzneria sp. 744]|uniref:RRQRL motif-containing zinc-binding protein n=1 Tax=Kutzneria sp. (strain 744) TaxID=345341 RepID=UPI0004BBEF38|nr:RRQRL motif-containing zinc-binding protein [Kutzneria sp. 744]
MANKVRPVVQMAVAWSPYPEFTHGTEGGLPLLPVGWAPKPLLATVRQLKTLGLRPGGHDPVAVLYGYSRTGGAQWFANLYLISTAKPMLAMTPAKWRALAKANLARRCCPECGRDRGYIIAPSLGMCFPCVEDSENTDPATPSEVAA